MTIVAEPFFNPNGTETLSDKLLKRYLPTVCVFLRLTVKSWKKQKSCDNSRLPTIHSRAWAVFFYRLKRRFPLSQELRKHPENAPYCVTVAQKGADENRAYQTGKRPLIYGLTRKTLLSISGHPQHQPQKRLAAYAEQYPDECCKTDTDPETGCMEFDIAKGRFSSV